MTLAWIGEMSKREKKLEEAFQKIRVAMEMHEDWKDTMPNRLIEIIDEALRED